MKRLFALFAAAAALTACGPENNNTNTIKDPEDNQQEISETVTVPEAYKDYTRVALKSSVTKVQPMTGIVMWAPYKSEDISLEYSYMEYNSICKEKDVYDWTVLDNLLEGIASRGHQAVIRFHYTYVGKKCTVPDYIKAWPGYEETVGKSEGRTTYFPDWRCEELRRFHMEFHRRLAERYDSDPRLAFLETGFGLWAEYHIYDGPFVMGKTFPSKDFQAEFMRGMAEWFKETTWSISIDAADNTYGPFQMDKSLLDLRFGNFDDSFMCQDHDGYNYESWAFFGKERYKKAPLGGEFSYYTDYDQKHCLDAGGMHGRKFEDEVAKFHMTFIIGADQPSYQKWDRIREASLSMGYKFRVKDFRVGSGKAALLVANVGVAPIYRDAWFAVDGVRSDYNLALLMPGNEVWIEVASAGLSSASVPAIECDHLVSGQKICFEADVASE
ncbi:MAG: DUF4832 domain-containing protein [Bacteroidales bacterium]|nr:DUF4832 domain-containing protein [Bacteroidales bacterium]